MGEQMDQPQFESNIEALVAFKALTGGAYLRLRPFELVHSIIKRDDENIVVKIITFEIDERRTETYLTNRGTKLVGYQLNGSGLWAQAGKPFTLWETDFQPTAINHYGPGKTQGQWLHDRAYARLCHRPGTSAQPMDSFYRTTAGHTPARMARHW